MEALVVVGEAVVTGRNADGVAYVNEGDPHTKVKKRVDFL